MDNLDLMGRRLNWLGGYHQEDRMIKDKYRSFQKALAYSYQACTVELVQPCGTVLPAETGSEELDLSVGYTARALINPDKVKQDYDDKIISIDDRETFGPGDVFEWKKTNTYWLIYLQQITEDAYFRGEIRRCRYRIKFKDANGNLHSTWAAIRGPVETQINSIQKNQIRVDQPNYSLDILMPKNEYNIEIFQRYAEFLLDGKCWRVEAVDSISMENIIEVTAEEYYIDREADDVENEIKYGLVIEKADPTPNSEIHGETFIKPRIPQVYSIDKSNGEWKVDENCPVSLTLVGEGKVEVIWKKSTSGEFTLYWSDGETTVEKEIVVETLF